MPDHASTPSTPADPPTDAVSPADTPRDERWRAQPMEDWEYYE